MKSQTKKSGVAIALYIFAAIVLAITIFKVYTSSVYIQEVVDYGTISYSNDMKDIFDYYLTQSGPYLIYSVILFALGYITSKVAGNSMGMMETVQESQDEDLDAILASTTYVKEEKKAPKKVEVKEEPKKAEIKEAVIVEEIKKEEVKPAKKVEEKKTEEKPADKKAEKTPAKKADNKEEKAAAKKPAKKAEPKAAAKPAKTDKEAEKTKKVEA